MMNSAFSSLSRSDASRVHLLPFKHYVWSLFIGMMLSHITGCNEPSKQEKREEVEVKPTMRAPVADRYPHYTTIHDTTLVDNYFWLRDKENPEVIAYIKAENQYADSMMSGTSYLQKELFEEMKGRLHEDESSVPVQKGKYFYYHRTEKDKQYRIYCRKKGSLDAEEEIVLDVNKLAAESEYFVLGSLEISPDHQMVAYTADAVGDESYSLYIKNISTQSLLEAPIPGLSPALMWANDNQTIFYTIRNEAYRPYKMFSHKVGSSFHEDKLVYHEEDERFFLTIHKSKNERYLLMYLRSKTATEVHYLEADDPNGPFKLFAARTPDVKYRVFPGKDCFYVLTNWDAVNYRLMKAPSNATEMGYWEEVVPEQPSVSLETLEEFEQHIALYKRVNGLRQIEVIPLNGKEAYHISFEDAAYTLYPFENPEYTSKRLFFTYTALATPREVVSYDMEHRTRTVMKKDTVLGEFNAQDYQVERVFATAEDGTQIPISLVYKKGMVKDGKNPLYLYGYGAYGITTEPAFNPNRLSLLDRGFVFAMAHIRGGGDMGEKWYLDGKLLSKKNSFTDFIACAEFLVEQKYTQPAKLVAMGGSAGGLLMGAVANMRSDLFEAIVAKVPFVDVINTMLDEALPLTITEYEEWGNPQNEQYFNYILSYSPYENVEAKAYPNMLITAGLNDPRVSYWEPAKWVAKLRATKTDTNRLLLKTNMTAGHSGASGRHDFLREIAYEYAFILDVLDAKEAGSKGMNGAIHP